MILSSRNLVIGSLGAAAVAAVVVACGSDNGSTFKDPDASVGFFQEAGFGDSGPDYTSENDDPPAGYCGPDSGADAIGGSVQCPDDKNLPGCGCDTPGETAPCWTGLRKNRNLGICKDGTATCKPVDETSNVWGPCEGEVLPAQDGGGAQGCNCFSVGTWTIANTAPCIWTNDNSTYYAYSTTAGAGGCTSADHEPPGVAETASWSTDTLNTDCAGTFTLCYRIRVGDFNNPQSGDCTLGEACIPVNYTQENVTQNLPDLPPWSSTDSACAKQWEVGTPDTTSPGYGEMYVKGGEQVKCDDTSSVTNDNEFIFNRVQYCPKACRTGYDGGADPATIADVCAKCQLSDKGGFGGGH